MGSQRVEHNLATEKQDIIILKLSQGQICYYLYVESKKIIQMNIHQYKT